MNLSNFSHLDDELYSKLPENMDMMQAVFLCPLMFCVSFVFLADMLKIPNQLLAMIYGTTIGITYYWIPFMQAEVIYFWKPDNVIVLCHPIMIAKVAYTINIYVFAKSKWQTMIVATIGTGIFILLFGFLVIVMTNRVVNLVNVVAAGTTLAAIDVPEVLMELNRIKNLEVIMDGESVFGAGLCIMTYNFCLGVYNLIITEWYHVVCLYCRYIFLGLAMGYIIGRAAVCVFRLFYHDSYNATVTLFGSCYLAYYLCEQFIYTSATICTFFVGYFIGKERSRLAPQIDAKVQLALDNAYNVVELLNCIVLSANVTYEMIRLYKGFDFAVAIGVYIMGNVLRILIFLMLSPILSRLGLGFNITALLTISWGAKRGSLQLLQVIYIAYYNTTEILGTELLCFTIVYLTLSFCINMTSLRYILKYFGLIEFTMARKYNITQCISLLTEKKRRLNFALKTNRQLSDLNWELIHRVTLLYNPYAAHGTENLQRASSEFETYCPTCNKGIPYLSSMKELHELFNDVKTKMLNRQRISLVRQFEMGLLLRNELEDLLQYIEMALNSAELNMPYHSIIESFSLDSTLLKCQKRMNLRKIYSPPIVWRRKVNIHFQRFLRSKWFVYLRIACIILNACWILAWIILACYTGSWSDNIILWIGYGMIIFFISEILMRLAAYNCDTFCGLYFRQSWYIIDICFLILDITALIASLAFKFHYIRIACLLRGLFLQQIDWHFNSLLTKYVSRKIGRKLAHAYCFGLAIVASMEDVQQNLDSFCKFPDVLEFLSTQLQNDKMRIMEMLAMVQLTRPGVAVTKSTFELEMAIVKTMFTTAQDIYESGVLEEFEYRIMRKIIERTTKMIHPTAEVPLNSAKTILREVAWMGDDEEMCEYLYSNIMLRIWESGDLICNKGDYVDGVIIIMQGLLKMTYKPDSVTTYNLKNYGMLPIKELLTNTNFNMAEEEYLFMGNTIGELSFLTNRCFNCKIEAMRSTSGLIITKAILSQACDFDTHPVNGLACRMWMHKSSTLMYQLLMEKLDYRNIAVTSVYSLLNRAFIPDISHYRVFSISNYIDDVILLDGVVIDKRSKATYVAPCCIPRSIHHLQMPKHSDFDIVVDTKIIVIPRNTVDAITVMKATEDMSDTIGTWRSPAPIRNSYIRHLTRNHAILVLDDKRTPRQKRAPHIKVDNNTKEADVTFILDYMSKKDRKSNFIA